MADDLPYDTPININPEVAVWLDNGGGVTIKTTNPHGDPVELSATEARRLAEVLLRLAEQDDAG